MNRSRPQRWLAVLALFTIAMSGGCRGLAARRHLTVENVRLFEGEGGVALPVAPHVGVNVGKRLFVEGTVTNHHASRSAERLELLVKLYRHEDSLKARHEYRFHDVPELERVAPGASAHFQLYVKETLRGYRRATVEVLGADLVP